MKVKDIADRHKGKAIFIVGAGPSLHFQKVKPLKKFITIAVNSGVLKVPFCDYFCSDDKAAFHWTYFDELKNLACTCLFFGGRLKGYSRHIDKNRIVWYDHKSWYVPSQKKYYPEGLILTKDPEKPIIGARTSSGSAIHLAYIMGGDPIILLGHDCCFKEGKRYFWQFPGEKRATRKDGGMVPLRPDAPRINGKQADKHSYDFLNYWKHLAKQTKEQNIRIINASGGVLDYFERMSFDEVLSVFEDRTKD